MIKYKLNCKKCKNVFDSWFSSSNEFDKLKKKSLITCHLCNSNNVDKTLMTPNVFHKTRESDVIKAKAVKKKLKEFKNFIKKNFEYVGDNFAYKARTIHYEKKSNKKGIYGNASAKEIEELKQEGITTETFPWIDDKDN
tara:strand:+ start:4997 stop:5413 length:417 start_codon:yes stop_codon:yes gene_type:complete